jgi:hypothetical protein
LRAFAPFKEILRKGRGEGEGNPNQIKRLADKKQNKIEKVIEKR